MHYGDRSMTENVIRQKKSYTSALAGEEKMFHLSSHKKYILCPFNMYP